MKFSWYNIAIGLLVIMQIQNAIGEAVPLEEVLVSFKKTGLPTTLLPFLVVTKLLAAFALLMRGYYLLKEWVFFGILVDIAGAGCSYLLSGAYDAFGLYLVIPALLIWAFAYYQFRKRVGSEHTANAGKRNSYRWFGYAFALVMIIIGIGELLQTSAVMRSLALLEIPERIIWLLGTTKILGGLAILLPGVPPTLKHWAYAGFAFDFAGALYLYLTSGQFRNTDTLLLVVLSALLAVAYYRFTNRPTAS